MSENPIEVYARRLLPKGHGYPLWVPEPYVQQYREEGVSIGDVGVITASGAFNLFFNICLPIDHPVNRRAPPDIEVVELINEDDVITLPHMHTKGGYVASSSIEQKRLSGSATALPNEHTNRLSLDPNPTSSNLVSASVCAGVSFESSVSEGGILFVPDGAARYDLDNIDKLRGQALLHGLKWYEHINGTLGRAITDGSLYLVTGCDKARSWAVASFSSSSERTEISFNVSVSQVAEGNALYAHSWETPSSVSVRIGPTLDPGQTFKENQCVFVRGFKVSVRTGWTKRLGPVKVTSILDASPRSLLPSSRGNFTPFARGASQNVSGGVGKGKGRAQDHGDHHECLVSDDTMEDEFSMSHDDISTESISMKYHPSTIINDFLLKAMPEAIVAVTHDSDWSAVYNDDDVLLDDEELLHRMHDRYNLRSASHGVFLAPKTPQTAILSDDNTDDDVAKNPGTLPATAKILPKGPIFVPLYTESSPALAPLAPHRHRYNLHQAPVQPNSNMVNQADEPAASRTAISSVPHTQPATTAPHGERFECRSCNKTFSRAHDRKRHNETHHAPTPVAHRCPRCGKLFSRSDSLRRHVDYGCPDADSQSHTQPASYPPSTGFSSSSSTYYTSSQPPLPQMSSPNRVLVSHSPYPPVQPMQPQLPQMSSPNSVLVSHSPSFMPMHSQLPVQPHPYPQIPPQSRYLYGSGRLENFIAGYHHATPAAPVHPIPTMSNRTNEPAAARLATPSAMSHNQPATTAPHRERFECVSCNQTFSRANDRKRHNETHHALE